MAARANLGVEDVLQILPAEDTEDDGIPSSGLFFMYLSLHYIIYIVLLYALRRHCRRCQVIDYSRVKYGNVR